MEYSKHGIYLTRLMKCIKDYHARCFCNLSQYLDLVYCHDCGAIGAKVRVKEKKGFNHNCIECGGNPIRLFFDDFEDLLGFDVRDLVNAVDRKLDQICNQGYSDKDFLELVKKWKSLTRLEKICEFEVVYSLQDDLRRARDKVARLEGELGLS